MSTRKDTSTELPKTFRRSRKLKRRYEYLNHRYFNGVLPCVLIGWGSFPSQDGDVLGACYEGTTIVLSSTITADELVWDILLHEMVHVKLMKAGHDARFQKEMKRLDSLGAFRLAFRDVN